MRAVALFIAWKLAFAESGAAAGPTASTPMDLGPVLGSDTPQINSSGQVTISRLNGPAIWHNGVVARLMTRRARSV